MNPEGAAVVKSLIKDYPSAGISFRQADISNWDELAAAFEAVYAEQGRIDVVMANAGISKEGPLIVDEEKPTKPSFKTVDVNLTGTLYSRYSHLRVSIRSAYHNCTIAIYLAIHYIKKNEANGVSKGSIIATASNAGLYAFSVAPIYAATKFGVVGLVRSLARPLAKELIQVNALAPAVLGEFISNSHDYPLTRAILRDKYRSRQGFVQTHGTHAYVHSY